MSADQENLKFCVNCLRCHSVAGEYQSTYVCRKEWGPPNLVTGIRSHTDTPCAKAREKGQPCGPHAKEYQENRFKVQSDPLRNSIKTPS